MMKKAIGIIFAIMIIARITAIGALASSFTTYRMVNNDAVLYQTNVTENKIEVSESFKGTKIVAVGAKVYKGNENLKEVSLPETIEWIGTEAFSGCTELEKVNIPKSVQIIERNTFYNCCELKNIVLPDGLCVIEEGAFEKSGLTEVKIPKGVIAIEKRAFADCQNLRNVTVHKDTIIADDAFADSCNVSIVIE